VKASELVRGQRGLRPLWLDRDSGDIAARVGEVAKADRQARADTPRDAAGGLGQRRAVLRLECAEVPIDRWAVAFSYLRRPVCPRTALN
jgi:hypothetical protein